MGPSYVCIFMGYFEYLLLQEYNKPVPEFYKRYIYDIIGANSMHYNQLVDFINFVHNLHPAVKFTYQISERPSPLNISLKQGILLTSIHYKTTDSHSYFVYHSSHTTSTKNSIPFSQFIRLRHLCSEKADEMTDFFINIHYPKTIILRKALDLVKLIPRQQTLQPNRVTAAEERWS